MGPRASCENCCSLLSTDHAFSRLVQNTSNIVIQLWHISIQLNLSIVALRIKDTSVIQMPINGSKSSAIEMYTYLRAIGGKNIVVRLIVYDDERVTQSSY